MSEDEAERMADRVGEDPEAGLAFAREPACAEREDGAFGGVYVLDPDVQMQLLGVLRVRPSRRDPGRRTLKCQRAVTRLAADDHPVAAVLVDLHPQHLRVERRKRSRVRAVQHRLLQPSDHAPIMLGASGQTQRSALLAALGGVAVGMRPPCSARSSTPGVPAAADRRSAVGDYAARP